MIFNFVFKLCYDNMLRSFARFFAWLFMLLLIWQKLYSLFMGI